MTVQLTINKGNTCDETLGFERPLDFTVGRAPDCDVELPNTSEFLDVSQHHCRFRIDPPKIWLSALEAKSGTYVNDLKISPCVGSFRLYDGDEVRLGHVRMRVHIPERTIAQAGQDLPSVNDDRSPVLLPRW